MWLTHPTARTRSTVRSGLTLPKLRRLSQTIFLALFLVLLCTTGYRGSLQPGELELRLPYTVRIFLETDPFIALANALATHALYRGLLWSLAILVPTLFLGRFFCGWICPLGTLNHLIGNIRSESKSGRRRIESNRYKGWQAFKYVLLFPLLAAAFLGSAIAGIFDPIALAVRSVGLSIRPGMELRAGGAAGTRPSSCREAGYTPQLQASVFSPGLPFGRDLPGDPRLESVGHPFLVPCAVPAGSTVGLVSRWSILGLEKHPEHCGDCNRCLLHCQGGDDPIPGGPWRKSECHLCMNCVADCPESGIRFRFFPPPSSPRTVEGADLQRRKVLTGLAAGAAAVPLLRANTGLNTEPHERLIRPPAALDEKQFLARCIRCGACMKVCPNNALHPALAEAGWEGIWTPVVVPRVGYCEPGCALCGEVCPTGAIWRFTAKEKAWIGSGTRRPAHPSGHGVLRPRPMPAVGHGHRLHCVPGMVPHFTQGHLPAAGGGDRRRREYETGPAAVSRSRALRGLWRMRVCLPGTGPTGRIRHQCRESRSETNQILLRRTAKPASWLPESGDAPGWTKAGETHVFEAADLWQYVDGDAERYLRAGVRRTLTAKYRYPETKTRNSSFQNLMLVPLI